MEWFLLEAFVALVIAVAIVWWTTSARRKPPESGTQGSDRKAGQ